MYNVNFTTTGCHDVKYIQYFTYTTDAVQLNVSSVD